VFETLGGGNGMSERNEEVPVLDVRGEICPYPMMKTNEELDKKRPGVAVLDVITDHPPALSTIPPQAMKRGYEVEIDEIDNGEWRLRLTKA
jgi:tRNA 2-thiouridine synthesizing protein A